MSETEAVPSTTEEPQAVPNVADFADQSITGLAVARNGMPNTIEAGSESNT